MSTRALVTFPLSPDVIRKLYEVGFRTYQDVVDFDAGSLSKVLRWPIRECEELVRKVKREEEVEVKGLMEVLREEFKDNRVQKIRTSVGSLDRKLNGGIPVGNVVEIYGAGGSGKTQICYQLCLNVQMPLSFKGLDGEALYIDTESRFKTERIVQMARHVSSDVMKEEFVEKKFLDRIYLVKVTSPEQLKILILYHLEEFLREHPRVRLVVLDSVCYQMRFSKDLHSDYRMRTKEIHLMTQQLRKIAHTEAVAVVITNQVTRNIQTDQLLPALGKTWSFTSSTKLSLQRMDGTGTRRVTIVKSRLKGPFQTLFEIKVRNFSIRIFLHSILKYVY